MATKKIRVMVTKDILSYIELGLAIRDALIELDFDAELVDDYLNFCDFNIIISARPFNGLIKDNINIHFETDHRKLIARKKWYIDYKEYTRSLHFFDYKKDLRHANIYFCPLGYSKQFDTDIPKRSKWPYFHLGATRPDLPRQAFRDKFNLTLHIYPAHKGGIWGRKRDNIIVRSKVNINTRSLHDYYFAPLHAALILYKGKMMLQEDFGKDDYYFFKPYLTFFTEDEFLDKLNYWIDHDKERWDWEHFIHEDMKAKYRLEDCLYGALGDLLEAYR